MTSRPTTVVALATSVKVPQLTDDDRLLVRALAAAGVSAEPAVWNDAAQDWTRYSAVVIRSTWDYHLKHDEFLAWLDRLEAAGVQVLNPPVLVRWNSQKGYLRDLAERGIEIVPTRWVARGEATSLASIPSRKGMEPGRREAVGVGIGAPDVAHCRFRRGFRRGAIRVDGGERRRAGAALSKRDPGRG